MRYGYVIIADSVKYQTNVYLYVPEEDVDWVAEGFANLPNSPVAGVWLVKEGNGAGNIETVISKGERKGLSYSFRIQFKEGAGEVTNLSGDPPEGEWLVSGHSNTDPRPYETLGVNRMDREGKLVIGASAQRSG